MLFSLDLLKLTHPASSTYKDDNDTAVMALRTSTKLFHIGDVSTESEVLCGRCSDHRGRSSEISDNQVNSDASSSLNMA